MWTKTRLLSIALISAFLFLFLPSAGSCYESRTYQISEEQLATLESNLTALKENNETLLHLLNASELDLNEASQSLSASRQELETLKAQLETLQSETKSLSESLRTANEELRRASESFKASEKERDKIEGRLRNQRNIWEALFFIVAGVAAAR